MTTPQQEARKGAPWSAILAPIEVDIRTIGIGLYIATFFLEGIGILARYIVVAVFLWFVSGINQFIIAIGQVVAGLQQVNPGFNNPSAASAPGIWGSIFALVSNLLTILASTGPLLIFLVTFGPPIYSLITFLPFVPGGFFFRKFALGARDPSFREQRAIDNALSQLKSASKAPVVTHYGAVHILDKPGYIAHVIGNTLYLSAPLIDAPNYLTAVLAHELGHANTFDGRLILALRRFVLFPIYFISRTFGQVAPGAIRIGSAAGGELGCIAGIIVWFFGLILSVAGGGFGLWALNLAWAWFWKEREYAADAYAAQLGQQGNLVQYLEDTKRFPQPVFDVAAPYLIIEPPAGELRQDRLEQPDTYSHRIDLRPALLIGALVFIGFCGIPLVSRAVASVRYGVQGPTWAMTRYCLFQGCDLNNAAASLEGGNRLELFFTSDARFIETQYFADRTVPMRQVTGTYSNIDANHILLNLQSSFGNIGFPLSGAFEVQRGFNTLTLVGSTGAYEFADARNVATSLPAPTEEQATSLPTPTEGPVATIVPSPAPQQALEILGLWVAGERTIELDPNGRFIQNPGNAVGTYSVAGNVLTVNLNNVTTDYTFTYENNHLTITPRVGEPIVFSRLPP